MRWELRSGAGSLLNGQDVPVETKEHSDETKVYSFSTCF